MNTSKESHNPSKNQFANTERGLKGRHSFRFFTYWEEFIKFGLFYPNVAKVGGLQGQGAKGAAVVNYCKPLATSVLESSGFPAGEKRWPKIDLILKFTMGLFLAKRFHAAYIQCP